MHCFSSIFIGSCQNSLGVVNIEGMLMLMGAFKEIRDHEAEAQGVSNCHESPICELYTV
jgi:hypothetical protein